MSNDNFEDMLNDSFAADAGISIGQKVEATVVSIGAEYVFLDLGIRSEGMILRNEFEADGELTIAVGDTLTVVTTAVRDGAMMCATRVGQGTVERSDDKSAVVAQIKDAQEAEMPVDGKITEVNKGGFNVDIFGLRAFCPISQIDTSYCETPEEHVGKSYSFMVTRIENDGRNIVVSRRAILEVAAQAALEQAWETFSPGDVMDGTVTSLQPYGAFVNIGGAEGLLHVSEISYTRIGHPEEVLEKGQTLKVQIKNLDPVKKKISLSLKSLESDPWDEFVASTTAGAVFKGAVTRVAEFGAFVEVAPGIQGLVHVSAMKVGEHVSNPRSVVSPGDMVEVRVREIDPEARRVSLAIVDHAAEEEQQATEQFRASNATGKSMGTLGDLLGKSLGKK